MYNYNLEDYNFIVYKRYWAKALRALFTSIPALVAKIQAAREDDRQMLSQITSKIAGNRNL